ncbi:MAG TPA: hypothetical protein VN706_11590 [Gemmatimonadaceae bacterium]|nr:hypothetical protein [Gemmatimonadaceae bacterium]
MKRHLVVVWCVSLSATAAAGAQGRGSRQVELGGPPRGPRCINPNMEAGVQITKGPPVAEQYGVDPANGVIVIRPAGDANLYIQPCSNFPAADDPFGKFLFAPDFVMSHQQAINLSEAQQKTIKDAVVYAQVALATAQMKTAGEVEKLQSMMQPTTVDEARVLDQVDRVLALERDIKRAQLSLMIRVKNTLTAQQQDALANLRPTTYRYNVPRDRD